MEDAPKEFAAAAVALVIGFIASPGVEWWKAWLAGSAQAKANKKRLVAQLRLTLGYLAAFKSEMDKAFGTFEGPIRMHEAELEALSRLRAFDLQPVRAQVNELVMLEIESLTGSAAGQTMIKHLLLLLGNFERLKNINIEEVMIFEIAQNGGPRRDGFRPDCAAQETIRDSEKCYRRFIIYVSVIYAPRLGMNMLSISFDRDDREIERLFMQQIIEEADERLQKANDCFKKMGENAERPIKRQE